MSSDLPNSVEDAFMLLQRIVFSVLLMSPCISAYSDCVSHPSEPCFSELAIRWNPKVGGPESAQKAFDVLKRALPQDEKLDKKSKHYTVIYFEPKRPMNLPEKIDYIARKRVRSDGETELMLKLRSYSDIRDRIGDLDDLCSKLPKGKLESKFEVDISFGKDSNPSRMYSASCSVKYDDAKLQFSDGIVVRELRRSEMTRTKSEKSDYKFDEWKTGDDYLIEVSIGNKKDTQNDIDNFIKSIVTPLLAANVIPMVDPKSKKD